MEKDYVPTSYMLILILSSLWIFLSLLPVFDLINMNDLLYDSFAGEANGQSSRQSDIEMGMQVPRSNSDVGMEAFNKQEPNEASKSVTNMSDMKAIKKWMEKYIEEVGKIAHGVKTKIEPINRDNQTNRQKPGCEKGTSIDSVRMNITNAFIQRFKDLMREFQTLRQKIKEEYHEVVAKRVITVLNISAP